MGFASPEGQPESGSLNININEYSGPKRIKCYPNLDELDFIDTESTTPAQEIVLTPSQLYAI